MLNMLFGLVWLNKASAQLAGSHSPATSIGYGPPTGFHLNSYTINPYGRQSSQSLDTPQSVITSNAQADIYINYLFDTTNKFVFVVYTTDGSEPTKTNNAGVSNGSFSYFSSPNRWWVAQIPTFAASTTIKYVVYISDSNLANAWGKLDSQESANMWDEDNNLGFSYTVQSPLPVSWQSFTATPRPTANLLAWATATERNNSHFEVERSADSRSWAAIGRVAGVGDSQQEQRYTFADAEPLPGRNYYRLRQVDFDGQFDYSGIVLAERPDKGGLRASPNPAASAELRLSWPADWFAEELQLYAPDGRLARRWTLAADQTEQPLAEALLPAGIYLARLVGGQGQELAVTKVWVQ